METRKKHAKYPMSVILQLEWTPILDVVHSLPPNQESLDGMDMSPIQRRIRPRPRYAAEMVRVGHRRATVA